ncbi:MAG: hypothetical protein D6679_08005 [Candidatus Hydrogenedentota bacterium]|nr:MAG: hypothetical protein D6679_08005 [Candidatus Hydrogenedentota bacterium]
MVRAAAIEIDSRALRYLKGWVGKKKVTVKEKGEMISADEKRGAEGGDTAGIAWYNEVLEKWKATGMFQDVEELVVVVPGPNAFYCSVVLRPEDLVSASKVSERCAAVLKDALAFSKVDTRVGIPARLLAADVREGRDTVAAAVPRSDFSVFDGLLPSLSGLGCDLVRLDIRGTTLGAVGAAHFSNGMVVDISDRAARGVLIQEGVIRRYFYVESLIAHGKEEGFWEKVLHEITLALPNAQRAETLLENVMVLGVTPAQENRIAETLRCLTDRPQIDGLGDDDSEKYSSCYGALLGLARADVPALNFLPEEAIDLIYGARRRGRYRKRMQWVCGIAFGVFLISQAAMMVQEEKREALREDLRKDRSKVEAVMRRKSELEEKYKLLEAAENLRLWNFSWAEFLSNLRDILPRKTWLESVSYGRDGVLKIRGSSYLKNASKKLEKSLKGFERLENVQIRKNKRSSDGKVFRFEIWCGIRK